MYSYARTCASTDAHTNSLKRTLTNLLGGKPAVLLFEVVQVDVERVKVTKLERRVIAKVPLSTGVVKALTVALAREVQPVRMAELVP